MNRNRITLFVFAALMLFSITACNKSGSGSGEKIQLALNVEPGYVQKIHYTMEQNITQKIMGMSQRVAQVTELFIKQEVVSVDPEGVADIKVTYERVKSSVETAITGKQSYDSDEASDKDSPLAAGYGQIVGKAFTMKMDKQSRVVDVIGLEGVMEGMMGEEDGEELDEVGNAMKSMFGPEAMKRNMQQMALVFPDVLVGEGDTWGSKLDMAGEFGLAADYTYKVENIDNEIVVLSVTSDIKTEKDASLDMGLMKMNYELSGTQDGNIQLDRKTGMVQKSELHQEIEGKVSAGSMNMPMSIRSSITFEPY